MELATLDISQVEAQERLAEYRRLVYEERTAEDDAIMMGLRAASRGLPLISLTKTILAGGFFPNSSPQGAGLPRMAIARADTTEVHVWWQWGGDLLFAEDYDNNLNRRALVNRTSVRVVGVTKPDGTYHNQWAHGSTVVPIIPPRHRPKRRRLHTRHILWEVESWTRQPPKDPALLRHIRGDVWAVLAIWDLTELERHVLSQRL